MRQLQRARATLAILLVATAGLLTYCIVKGYTPKLGLDLAGGTSVVLQAPRGTKGDALAKAIDIVRSRTDALGIAEPDITREGDRNIVVQMPGLKDQKRALEVIGTTASLDFRSLVEVFPASAATTTTTKPGEPPNPAAAPQAPPLTCPDRTKECKLPADKEVVVKDKDTGQIMKLGTVSVPGREVTGATAQLQQADVGGGWQVALEFTKKGETSYKEVTGKAACNPAGDPKRQIAITLDNEVVSAPQVAEDVKCNEGISGGGVITLGEGTAKKSVEAEAKDLALVLRYGSLPVALTKSNVETVSPTLGRDSLDAGKVAAVVGLVLIAAFLLLMYRLYGVVVLVGIAIFGALNYTVISLLGEWRGQTLALSGLAGLVVSLGVTADSYIVYVERMKDELRQGRSMRTAVERGFTRAWRTIVAADTVSVLASGALYLLAVGSVRGFALMLGIATLLDMLMAYCFTRPLMLILADTRLLENEHRFVWARPARAREVAS